MLYEIDNPDDIPPQQPGLGWIGCKKCGSTHRSGAPCPTVIETTTAPAPVVDAEKRRKLEQVANLADKRGELRIESREKAEALASVMTHESTSHQEDRYTAKVCGGELRLTIDRCFPVNFVTFASAKQLKLERAQAAIEEAAARMARKRPSNTDTEQDAHAEGELQYVPLPHVA